MGKLKVLRALLVLIVIAALLAIVMIVLGPEDRLSSLQPFVLSDQVSFIADTPSGGTERCRTIDLKGISSEGVRDLLLKRFPKTGQWGWSGSPGFYQVDNGFYQVLITPAPIGGTPGATAQVVEYCPLDGRTLAWERIKHLGRLPISSKQ